MTRATRFPRFYIVDQRNGRFLWYTSAMLKLFHIALLILGATVFVSHANAEQYLTGRLLIAGEDMNDPMFVRSVILILEHDRDGAFGVVLNRVIGTGPFGKLIATFGIKPRVVDEAALSGIVELRQGGPVEPNRVIAVHSTDFEDSGSHDIGNGVAWTREPTVLAAVAAGHGPENILIFIAYAGWASGQLEGEIERGSWLDADADSTIIFHTSADDLYDAVKGTGGLSL